MPNLSRRHLVTTAAALPAPAVPAVAALAHEPDPIFVAIEKHRQLDAETMEADIESSNASHRADLKAKTERLGIKTERAAADALAEVAPTTIAGVGALVAYVSIDLIDGEAEWVQPALVNAARAANQIAQNAVQSRR
jgi:hypothetical protein